MAYPYDDPEQQALASYLMAQGRLDILISKNIFISTPQRIN
jgi:hypothetical protein